MHCWISSTWDRVQYIPGSMQDTDQKAAKLIA